MFRPASCRLEYRGNSSGGLAPSSGYFGGSPLRPVACLAEAEPSVAALSEAEPSEADPSEVDPSQAGPPESGRPEARDPELAPECRRTLQAASQGKLSFSLSPPAPAAPQIIVPLLF